MWFRTKRQTRRSTVHDLFGKLFCVGDNSYWGAVNSGGSFGDEDAAEGDRVDLPWESWLLHPSRGSYLGLPSTTHPGIEHRLKIWLESSWNFSRFLDPNRQKMSNLTQLDLHALQETLTRRYSLYFSRSHCKYAQTPLFCRITFLLVAEIRLTQIVRPRATLLNSTFDINNTS